MTWNLTWSVLPLMTHSVLEAIRQVGTDDPAAMRDAIAGLKDFSTVTGKLINYTENGKLSRLYRFSRL